MKIGRNDPCLCGSGKKYKYCCLMLRPSSQTEPRQRHQSQLSLDERNIVLLDETFNIFGFSRGVKWDEVQRTISTDQVRQLYQLVRSLWPPNTNVESILPAPSTTLRALYLGDMRPDIIARSVFQFSLYADEILIVNPFHNPLSLPIQHNPLANPHLFKEDALKVLYCLRLLEPWIRAGYVRLIPDPTVFDPALAFEMYQSGMERITSQDHQIHREDTEEMKYLVAQEMARSFSTMPPKQIEETIREKSPDYSDEQVAELLAGFQMLKQKDPLILNQPGEEIGNQILATRGG